MWLLEEVGGCQKHEISESTLIGRSPLANIILTSVFVSKQHCRLMAPNDNHNELFILDLNSSNGVFINKIKIVPNTLVRLHESDIIGIGVPEMEPGNPNFKLFKVQMESQPTNDIINIEDSPIKHIKSPILMVETSANSRKRLASDPTESNRPSKIANLSTKSEPNCSSSVKANEEPEIRSPDKGSKENEQCSIFYDDNEFSFSQCNVTIVDEDENSNDLFSEDIQDVKNIELLEYSQTLNRVSEVDDVIFEISSDEEEEDNIWLERLSQGSRHSPPPLQQDDEWWPKLSQSFLDEIESEEKEVNVTKESKKDNRSDRHKSKYTKPIIIDAPAMAKPAKGKTPEKSRSRSRTKSDHRSTRSRSKKSPERSKSRTEVQRKSTRTPSKHRGSSDRKTYEDKTKKKEIADHRKEKLKEIAAKEKKTETPEHKKEKSRPKVKLTNQNRSDLLISDVSKPNRTPQKTDRKKEKSPKKIDKLAKFKIPKKTDKPKDEPERSETSSSSAKKEEAKNEKDRRESRSSSTKKELEKKDNTKSNRTRSSSSKINERKDSPKNSKSLDSVDGKKDRIRSPSKKDENTNPSKVDKKIADGTSTVKVNEVPDIVNKPRRSILRSIQNQIPIVERKSVKFNLDCKIQVFEIEEGNRLNRFDKEDQKRCLMEHRARADERRDSLQFIRIKKQVRVVCLPIEDIIWYFVNWDPAWLITSRNASPIEMTQRLEQNRLSFDTFEQYYQIFSQLALCEMFSHVKKQSEMGSTGKRVFQVHLQKINHKNHCELTNQRYLSSLDIMLLINKHDDMHENHPKVGEIVIIQVPRFIGNEVIRTKCFGYITYSNKESSNSFYGKLPPHLMETCPDAQVLLSFSILTKFDPTIVAIDKTLHLRVITRLGTFTKQFIAIQRLPTSTLMPLVLNPMINSPEPVQYQKKPLFSKHTLNDVQLEAVFENCDSSLMATQPKISLIHGPPGTGKSYVIVNIVLELLYGDNRYELLQNQRKSLPKILLCAPSNAAADSLAIRLLNVRKNIPDSNMRFRMVRVGQVASMDPSAKAISLQSLCDNYKYKLLYDAKNLPAESSSTHFVDRQCKEYSDLLLDKADVVCTTLGSCFNSQLERLSKKSTFRFTCCIMDEATQCSEPDSILPLLFGIDSLILVGDPRQLPATVISPDAKKYGYGQSLFERFEKCYNQKNVVHKNAIKFLNTQYRMHPEISKFPNEYFYQNQLINGPNVLEYNFPLVPYLIFNHEYQQDSSEYNLDEVQFTITLLKAVLSMLKNPASIGIIAPYNQQCSRIERGIQDIDSQWKHLIKINTIDGFQGLERDIIIFSCVRTDGIGFLNDNNRLNVALTRARQAMYLVVNFHSLQKNSTWNALKTDAEQRKLVYCNRGKDMTVEDFQQILKSKKM